MKKYESVFILDIRKTDDNGVAFCNGFAELIKSLGGEIEKTVEMGRKQFTYEIDKRRAGLYFDFIFTLDPAKLVAIREKYHLDQQVLRSMTLIYDRPEGADNAEPLRVE